MRTKAWKRYIGEAPPPKLFFSGILSFSTLSRPSSFFFVRSIAVVSIYTYVCINSTLKNYIIFLNNICFFCFPSHQKVVLY